MDPDEVGRLVLDGIREGRFWMLTHPTWAKALKRQVEALMEDGSLTRG
jgi:hypothetical protein